MIIEQVKSDIKDAMRAKDKVKLNTLRSLTAEVKQIEIDTRVDATDADVLAIIIKGVKTRQESAEQYKNADRSDLEEIELKEIEILRTYQPAQLTEDEIATLVDEAIASTGAESGKDMGKVMGALMGKTKGKADGGVVSRIVKEKLN